MGADDEVVLRKARRDFFIRTLMLDWASLTERDRRRLRRHHPILEIALTHLIEDGLMTWKDGG